MVFSKYNICQKTENNDLIIYNTLSNKVIRLTEEYNSKLNLVSVEKNLPEVIEFLRSAKIVTEKETEEEEINSIHKQFLSTLASTIFITLIPTFKCNFNCPYCYENHEARSHLTDSDYEQLLEEINSSNIIKNVYINLFGGEPLLVFGRLISFISALKANKNLTVIGGITTNGYLLTPKRFNKLYELGIKSYQITIDGNPETHNKNRCLTNGEPTYDIIFKNLIDIKKKEGEFHFTIRCNIDRDSKIDKFIEDFKKHFKDDSRFSLFIFPISNWSNSLDCSNLISRGEILKKYTSLFKNNGIQDHYLDFYINSDMSCEYSYPNAFVVLPNGKIDFCTIYMNENSKLSIKNYFENIHHHNNKKLVTACTKKDCVLFPKCFGFVCKKVNRDMYCDNYLNEIKFYLKEYFL